MKELVNETLVSIGMALVTLAGAYSTYYIKKLTDKLSLETKKLEDEAQRKLVEQALNRLDDVVEKTVNKIEQTTVKKLKKSISQGLKDKSELKYLAIEAYDEIRKTLEPEYLDLLEDTLGDARTYIKNTIEDKVLNLKGAK
jgi:CHAD domain-containing protein